MNDTDKPDLSLGVLTEIADELYLLDKDLWAVLRPMLMPKGVNENTSWSGPRPPKLSAKFYLILSNFSREMFLKEASSYPRYPPNPNFSNWLLNLAQRTEDHTMGVVRDIEASNSEKSFAYHCVSEDEMRKAIQKTLHMEMEQRYSLKTIKVLPPLPLPPQVQAQMTGYAASGVDIASGSPLLIMAASAARAKEPAQPRKSEAEGGSTRLPSTVNSPSAARKMEAYLLTNGIGLTDFANSAGTTDRTLRSFRKSGKIRRGLLVGIARAMGTTKDDLLSN